MAYGYSTNVPRYGYQRLGNPNLVSPYYRAATQQGQGGFSSFPSPNDRPGPLGAGAPPFQLATRPDDRPGPFGAGQIPAFAPAAPPVQGEPKNQLPFTSQAPGAPSSPPQLSFDYSTDPILQQIQALGTQTRSAADTNALKLRKQLAIRFGDADFARKTLGDTETAQAAEGNPYSVFSQLRRQQDLATQSLDEQLNAGNLFFSGARIKGQGQLADAFQAQQAAEAENERQALDAIDQGRLAAILSADERDRQAESDAYGRAIQLALAGGFAGTEAPQASQAAQALPLGPVGASPATVAGLPFAPDAEAARFQLFASPAAPAASAPFNPPANDPLLLALRARQLGRLKDL